MKILCMCQYGHSRSVALARLFHSKNIEAVAVGWMTAGKEALCTLSGWADKICILQKEFLDYVPEECREKVVVIDVGPDKWVNPYHPELEKLVKKLAKENGLIKE